MNLRSNGPSDYRAVTKLSLIVFVNAKYVYYLQSKLRAGKGTFGRIFSKKSFHHKSINEIKNKNNHTDGTFPNFNRKINGGGKIDTPNTQIHNHSLSWLTKGISIKCGGVEIVSCAQSFRSINIRRV
jgi:hypothetical protein